MRVVVAHNFYGSHATGGESVVFHQEVELLRRAGHAVETIECENAEIERYSLGKKFISTLNFGFSREIYDLSMNLFRRFQPDVLHVHNYKYVLTPAIFQAARDSGVGSVLSLHNYRLICPGGQLRRGEIPCEECLNHSATRVLWRSGCASSFSTRALQYAFYLETRKSILENVDVFVALTEYAKKLFIRGGLPRQRIVVKPNFFLEPSSSQLGSKRVQPKLGAIFIGRLSEEKGVRFLLEAWHEVDCPLTIIGDGPMKDWVRLNATPNVTVLGEKSHSETLELLQKSEFLVFPSVWYEGMPMTLVEACAMGVPVIASNLGGRGEIVKDNLSGLLFDLGERHSFISAVEKLHNNSDLRDRLSCGARRVYKENFTPEKNVELLNSIYRQAIESRANML
jgi:glycosyltransferase involved in cell wall biosynthesis